MTETTTRPDLPPLCITGPVAISCIPRVASVAIKTAVLASFGVRCSSYGELHHHHLLRLRHVHEVAAESHLVFVFVRDPLARLFSLWSGMAEHRMGGVRAVIDRREPVSFNEFVELLTPDNIWRNVHLVPQNYFAPVGADIVEFGHLAAGWEKVRRRWAGLQPLPLANVSPKIAVPIPRETRRRVRALYQMDYERFGYW